MVTPMRTESDADILRQIAHIAIDGLDPAMSRVALVNKMKLIFDLADRDDDSGGE